MNNCGCNNRQFGHPCFDADSRGKAGRVHLPVAPACNIQCRYCSRKHDCANENRPGVTTRIITPEEAVERVRLAVLDEPRISVAGIAGPGDPLANTATFKTLELVRNAFPGLSLCLSTNGLLLADRLDELVKIGVNAITVTLNTLDAKTGVLIYSYVRYKGEILKGWEAARCLLERQVEGLRLAAAAGFRIKVNSVLIPGINDREMVPIARFVQSLDIRTMNIMPLIPQAEMASHPPVPDRLLSETRAKCAPFTGQIAHCRQCRADACGLLV